MVDIQQTLEQAKLAAKNKDFAMARTLIKQVIQQEPYNLNAWMIAAHVVETREDSIRCFQKVLQIEPGNSYARQKLEVLQAARTASSGPAATPQPAAPTISPPPPSSEGGVTGLTPRPTSASQSGIVASQPSDAQPAPKTTRSTLGMGMIGLAVVMILVFCLAGLGAWAVTSGGLSLGSPAGPTPTSAQLFDVLNRHADAGNRENMDAVLATIHPKSRVYASTKALMEPMFVQYDLYFQFYNMEVLSVSSTEAQVHFSMVTRRLAGPAFQDNIVTGIMYLRPDNGVWKIYSQKTEKTEYLP